MSVLYEFVRESNRIEGIHREPTEGELDAHGAFIALRSVTLPDLEAFVSDIAAVPLRRTPGQNVRVGNHFPPPGGPEIERQLRQLLGDIADFDLTPYGAHIAYEKLHPFLDGNGRSGRALWAWMMQREGRNPFHLPFLHAWYYQSLDASRIETSRPASAGVAERSQSQPDAGVPR